MFTLTTKSPNLTSLQIYRDDLTAPQVENLFGPHNYYFNENDDGYGGPEWHFEDQDGNVVTLYMRFARVRIGAIKPETAEAFSKWINEKILTAPNVSSNMIYNLEKY